MKVIRRYFFRSIIGMITLVLGVLLGLVAFIEFVTQLDDIGTGNYGIFPALLYTALKLPNFASQMMPIAVLLGALLGLGGLANHGELVILRASGVSMIRLAGSVLWTGLALSLFAMLLGEYVGPSLDNYARQYRAEAKHAGEPVVTGHNAWIRDGDTFLNISRLGDDFRLGGIYLYRLDSAGKLAGIARADSASVDEAGQWVLSNFKESLFVGDGVKTNHVRRLVQPTNLSPDLISLTVVRPDTLTGIELFRHVQYLKHNELDPRRYVVAFWSRIAAAVAAAPMCVLALPFVFGRMRSSGPGSRMVVGLIVGLGYFLASRGFADGGQVYGLDPLLIAWLPTIVLAAVAFVAVVRTR